MKTFADICDKGAGRVMKRLKENYTILYALGWIDREDRKDLAREIAMEIRGTIAEFQWWEKRREEKNRKRHQTTENEQN